MYSVYIYYSPIDQFTSIDSIIVTVSYKLQGVPKKKKGILNIHIESEGINIFSQRFCWTESSIFVVKCQKFTFIVQLFMT